MGAGTWGSQDFVHLLLSQGCHPPVYGDVLHRTCVGYSTGLVILGI